MIVVAFYVGLVVGLLLAALMSASAGYGETRGTGSCGPRCQGQCVASGARQPRGGRTLYCEPPRVLSEPPPPPPRSGGRARREDVR